MKQIKSREVNNRIIFSHKNSQKKLTLICIAGIHGNEPAGIYGLQNVISIIEKKSIKLNANFYALRGNITALKHKVRFLDHDLNRLWTEDKIKESNNKPEQSVEFKEQIELFSVIKEILNAHNGDFVFLDLHTTSSNTMPFITISDSLNNRSLANKFNIPIVLGIEEYLNGPLLTYINEYGHTSLGFEAGQHDDEQSVLVCEAFLWLLMVQLGLINKEFITYQNYQNRLYTDRNGFYEILYRYTLDHKNNFKMISKFGNFEEINKGELLAIDNGKEVKSTLNGLIFMPLYQNQGDDGFFIVKKVSKFWLILSKLLRKLYIHNILSWFPGVKKDKNNNYTLIVNPNKALFLAREIFHLFGYRTRVQKEELMYVTKRDRKVKTFN